MKINVSGRAIALAVSGALALLTFTQSASSGPQVRIENPWERVAVSMFDEEHAHLAEKSPFDDINPLILAAMPKGKARIHYNAPSKCIPGSLKAVLADVSKKFGPITVNSTYRSPGKNRKVGGKGKSLHLGCRAVDFRVHGSTRGLLTWLRGHGKVGGYKRYSSGFYHIDNGPKRTW